MRVAVAGAHGQIAIQLIPLLAARGDSVVGLIRNPAHADEVREAGAEPVVLDLEQAGTAEIAARSRAPTPPCSPQAPARAAAPSAR